MADLGRLQTPSVSILEDPKECINLCPTQPEHKVNQWRIPEGWALSHEDGKNWSERLKGAWVSMEEVALNLQDYLAEVSKGYMSHRPPSGFRRHQRCMFGLAFTKDSHGVMK